MKICLKKSKIKQIKTTKKRGNGLLRGESNPRPSTCEVNMLSMNDFPVIGDPCFVHRVLVSLGGNIASRDKENVWRGVVSPLKAVSLDTECRVLLSFYEKQRSLMLVL